MACSKSWAEGHPYNADNWLVTPQLALGKELRFWVYVNASYPDSYEVLLSTTGNAIKDFTIGYAYDINTMGLGMPGSHEVSLGYCFKLDLDRTPRDYRSVRYL